MPERGRLVGGINGSAADAKSARDVSLDYLRATLTLMVVAHHSSLAYTDFAHIDSQNYLASTAPVVDEARWLFLDYAENFNDVFFMSLMFFMSGLFVLPSLRRSGAAAFLRHRFVRLGLPFAVGVTVLMPRPIMPRGARPVIKKATSTTGVQNITTHGGLPARFGLSGCCCSSTPSRRRIRRISPACVQVSADPPVVTKRPLPAFGVMIVVCALVYLPMLSIFGFDLGLRW